MPKRNGAAHPSRPKNRRRKSALSLLQEQLASGVKPMKGSLGATLALEEGDVKRIKREIEILQKKIIR